MQENTFVVMIYIYNGVTASFIVVEIGTTKIVLFIPEKGKSHKTFYPGTKLSDEGPYIHKSLL